jgi:hypothetical protein
MRPRHTCVIWSSRRRTTSPATRTWRIASSRSSQSASPGLADARLVCQSQVIDDRDAVDDGILAGAPAGIRRLVLLHAGTCRHGCLPAASMTPNHRLDGRAAVVSAWLASGPAKGPRSSAAGSARKPASRASDCYSAFSSSDSFLSCGTPAVRHQWIAPTMPRDPKISQDASVN